MLHMLRCTEVSRQFVEMGQKPKYSYRTYVFCFAAESRHQAWLIADRLDAVALPPADHPSHDRRSICGCGVTGPHDVLIWADENEACFIGWAFIAKIVAQCF
jgi:hypothetical protein